MDFVLDFQSRRNSKTHHVSWTAMKVRTRVAHVVAEGEQTSESSSGCSTVFAVDMGRVYSVRVETSRKDVVSAVKDILTHIQ